MTARSDPTDRSDGFVGRADELEQAVAALEDALASQGRVLLISGEPGIGKSSLAGQIARISSARGSIPVWGRCWEAGGAPSYWPWVQSLRALVRDKNEEDLRRLVGSHPVNITQILPELAERIPDIPLSTPTGDPDAARFRLFDAMADFLRRAGDDAPLTVILDDIHTADVPSLLLLQFVSAQLENARLLIVATYRDSELDRVPFLADALADIARTSSSRRIALRGFSETDVATYVATTTGASPTQSLVTALHLETEGNPLFVGEVVRLLASEGRLDDARDVNPWRLRIPEGLREVIGSRLNQLTSECRQMLQEASVLGRDLRLDILASATGIAGDDLLDLVAEATAARLITDVPGAPGYVRFSHALVRDALYEQLKPSQRVRLHRGIADVMEVLVGDHPDHLAGLAHHYFEAIPAGVVRKAIVYSHRAAEEAMRLLAFEEAARLYEMALHALDREEKRDGSLQCYLLIGLGEAQMRAGQSEVAKRTFHDAAALARKLKRSEAFARAALGYGGRIAWARASGDTTVIQLLEEALQVLPVDDSELRCRVLTRLASAKRDEPDGSERDELSAQAIEMATRMNDLPTLAYALGGRYGAILSPSTTKERLEITDRQIALAIHTGDKEREIEGRLARFTTLAELGEMDAARLEHQRTLSLSGGFHQPMYLALIGFDKTNLALFEGRYREAEEHATAAADVGFTSASRDVTFAQRIHTFLLLRDQGRAAEAEDLLKRSVDEYPWYPFVRCLLANLYAELGREEDARHIFDRLAASGFELPFDNPWLFGLSFLPEVARFLHDAPAAAQLYDMLLPYADRNAVTVPEAMTGSVARGLGILAATCRRWNEAEEHFTTALQANNRMGARPWVARTERDFAEMLLERDAPGDRERALTLLTGAHSTATELGMISLAEDTARFLERIGGRAPVAVSALDTSKRATKGVLRREGEYWSVVYENDRFRLRDSKGLRYLAHLLRAPDREWHVLDLVGAGSGASGRAPRASAPEETALGGLGDAGPLLDTQAKAEYKRRLDDLEEDIVEAETFGDAARASRSKSEKEFLIRELAGAVGLGGRDRKAASASERARINVTRAIKNSLERIAENSPELGRHFAATVHTGTFCSYTPDPRSSITWTG